MFVNSIDRCYKLKLFLEQFGIPACVLNSELPHNSRWAGSGVGTELGVGGVRIGSGWGKSWVFPLFCMCVGYTLWMSSTEESMTMSLQQMKLTGAPVSLTTTCVSFDFLFAPHIMHNASGLVCSPHSASSLLAFCLNS